MVDLQNKSYTCTTEIFSLKMVWKHKNLPALVTFLNYFTCTKQNSACLCAGKTPLNWTLIGFVSKRHCHSFCVGRQSWTITVKCAISSSVSFFYFKIHIACYFLEAGIVMYYVVVGFSYHQLFYWTVLIAAFIFTHLQSVCVHWGNLYFVQNEASLLPIACLV